MVDSFVEARFMHKTCNLQVVFISSFISWFVNQLTHTGPKTLCDVFWVQSIDSNESVVAVNHLVLFQSTRDLLIIFFPNKHDRMNWCQCWFYDSLISMITCIIYLTSHGHDSFCRVQSLHLLTFIIHLEHYDCATWLISRLLQRRFETYDYKQIKQNRSQSDYGDREMQTIHCCRDNHYIKLDICIIRVRYSVFMITLVIRHTVA